MHILKLTALQKEVIVDYSQKIIKESPKIHRKQKQTQYLIDSWALAWSGFTDTLQSPGHAGNAQRWEHNDYPTGGYQSLTAGCNSNTGKATCGKGSFWAGNWDTQQTERTRSNWAVLTQWWGEGSRAPCPWPQMHCQLLGGFHRAAQDLALARTNRALPRQGRSALDRSSWGHLG